MIPPGRTALRAGVLALVVACTGEPEPAGEPAPSPAESAPARPVPAPSPAESAEPSAEVVLPEVAWRLPERSVATPHPSERTDEVQATRDLLARVVERYALDPGNPWAIGHAMLVLGPDAELSNGETATDCGRVVSTPSTPADAALMMQLGCDGVFVGSGIFKSDEPERRGRAIVEAVTYFNDAERMGTISTGLGEAMVGINMDDVEPGEMLQTRGQ